MTATYNPALPADLDKVRFLVGDTVVSDAQVTDEEIAGALALTSSVYAAAAAVADALAAKYSSKTSVAISGLISVAQEQKAQAYGRLADRLRAQATTDSAGGLGAPFIGGVSKSTEQAVVADTDRNENRFRIGIDDYPGSVP